MELNPPNHYNKSTRIFGDRGLLARPIIRMAGNFSRVTVRAKTIHLHTHGGCTASTTKSCPRLTKMFVCSGAHIDRLAHFPVLTASLAISASAQFGSLTTASPASTLLLPSCSASPMRVATLVSLAGTDRRTKANGLRLHFRFCHPAQQAQSELPLLSLSHAPIAAL